MTATVAAVVVWAEEWVLVVSRDLTCLLEIRHCCESIATKVFVPSKALNAGSTFPPLAIRTALTTAASIEGNASRKVFSACCCGFKGRGGFGGGVSSTSVFGIAGISFSEVVWIIGFVASDVMGASSSNSSSCAIGAESGRTLAFCIVASCQSRVQYQPI